MYQVLLISKFIFSFFEDVLVLGTGTGYGNSSYRQLIFKTLISNRFDMICVSELHFYVIEYLQFIRSGKIFFHITFSHIEGLGRVLRNK